MDNMILAKTNPLMLSFFIFSFLHRKNGFFREKMNEAETAHYSRFPGGDFRT